MKISIGMNLQSGPWGGGNQFGQALVDYLQRQKVDVTFDLRNPNLDLILLAEPRVNLKISAYADKEIIRYLLLRNRQAIVVHRINECDERKGTQHVNHILIKANQCADHTVFVSTWLKTLFFQHGLPSYKSHGVIINGSDKTIFNPIGYHAWDRKTSIKLVTHHWGGSWLKGFDIYERLDQLLATEPYKHTISFTYIGNLPKGFRFHNSTYIEPKSGHELANAIRQNHVYLTASQNEPGGNHQNEGALCGLPLLYRESGCMPEYCHGFGISFNPDNFEQKLNEMMTTYPQWVKKMLDYPNTAEQTCTNYYTMFTELLDKRESLLKQRDWMQSHKTILRAFIPNRLGKLWQRITK
ncbi:MAG: hypothetical protein B6242_11540 [Anaerolineaceae bacterium 4572_78]|nr:MAG: hypothetical protein B6242_11540 [Anaerolineaceae bacterium 4572_78]